jgi:antitoxin HicB
MFMATRTRRADNTVAARARKALEVARQHAAGGGNWIAFHNALFGIGGCLTELFPTQAERVQFGKTAEHRQIMELLEQLQDAEEDQPEPLADASGRFILRVPRSMHAALMAEAKAEGISLNQLCVAKLATQLRAAAVAGNGSRKNLTGGT